ncbi:hypothetical protein EDEG_01570 [Edhazardia aedis USNM 41457]|uniref:Ubiquitin-activating enzyme E1 C-terminal domain-containing protein n=1 Tax=Edhazardia aedis (strain USNM 41457) TaxID=1003232 RepID=J9D9G5_EDHAE|nr:hypothetical protein EDEG_01570 [Edhazardia aedis USNM 41457]|eukprot:EJW04134.1 hypothetical protein EDEG_01570 [Edhazardia aedis USNM 41457]
MQIESHYSRQLYVLGNDAQTQLSSSKVLLLGLSGQATEICKNIVLTGVKEVFLYDNTIVKEEDLCCGYWFTKEDVGRNRRDICLMRSVSDLNPFVSVRVLFDSNSNNGNKNSMKEDSSHCNTNYTNNNTIKSTIPLIDTDMLNLIEQHNFTCIVCTNLSNKEILRISKICKIVANNVDGFFTRVFTDFKKDFLVKDLNGEPVIIGNFSEIVDNTMFLVENERHGLEDGDFIRIYEDENHHSKDDSNYRYNSNNTISSNNITNTTMNNNDLNTNTSNTNLFTHKTSQNEFQNESSPAALNSMDLFEVSVVNPFTLKLKGFVNNTGGGTFEQVKIPKLFSYKPFELFSVDSCSKKEVPPILYLQDFDVENTFHCFYLIYDKLIEIKEQSRISNKNQCMTNNQNEHIPDQYNNYKYINEICDTETNTKFKSYVSIDLIKELDSDIDKAMEVYNKEKNSFPFEIDTKLVKQLLTLFYINMGNNLMAVSSVIGGFVAQEVIKACTNKFTPLNQFMYYNVLEIYNCDHLINITNINNITSNLNNNIGNSYANSTYNNISSNNLSKDKQKNSSISSKYSFIDNYIDYYKKNINIFLSYNSQYSPLIRLINKSNFNKLSLSKVLILGSGAIGCEHLKNNCMMGISKNGKIIVADMDSIELSNLNRQFLFKKEDIGKMKSEVAVKAVLKMNPDYKNKLDHNIDPNASNDTNILNDSRRIVSLTTRVGKETQDTYSDKLLSSMCFVANALDNVETRRYIDNRITILKKPLFESGTLGTKGNTQIVIPNCYENYSSSVDPPEKQIPMCTLRNFPYNTVHCVEFSVNEFKKEFEDNLNKICEFSEKIFSKFDKKQVLNAIENIKPNNTNNDTDLLNSISNHIVSLIDKELIVPIKSIPTTKTDCITAAFVTFYTLFNIRIKKWLITFPLNHKTSEGTLFWSPPKRPPFPLDFSFEKECLDYVLSFCELLSQNYSKNFLFNENDIKAFIEHNSTYLDEFIKYKEWSITNDENVSDLLSSEELEKLNTSVNNKSNNVDNDIINNNNDFNNTNNTSINSIDKPKISEQNVFKNYIEDNLTKSDIKKILCLNQSTMKPIEFEKDDNLHIKYIASLSNLRAKNYRIKQTTHQNAKQIAGKIIPAIATTTALISGLSYIEILKYIMGNKEFRNTYVTLALPFIGSSEPQSPVDLEYFITDNTKSCPKDCLSIKNMNNIENSNGTNNNFADSYTDNNIINPLGLLLAQEYDKNYPNDCQILCRNGYKRKYNIWTQVIFKNCTLNQFIQFFKQKYNQKTSMIICNDKIVFATYYNQSEFNKNLDKKFTDLTNDDFIIVDIMLDSDCENFPLFRIMSNV